MTREWKSVVGYEGLYEVSNDGLVRSLERRNTRGALIRERILKGCRSNGYLNVKLFKDGVSHTENIHVLVAKHFIGPCPDGLEVCHNDGNRSHNRFGNLRYDTRKGNLADKLAHGTMNFGERNGAARLTVESVETIRALHASGTTQIALAHMAGIHPSVVSRVVNRRIWNHI